MATLGEEGGVPGTGLTAPERTQRVAVFVDVEVRNTRRAACAEGQVEVTLLGQTFPLQQAVDYVPKCD